MPRSFIQELPSPAGWVLKTYFAQQHHSTGLIRGQTSGGRGSVRPASCAALTVRVTWQSDDCLPARSADARLVRLAQTRAFHKKEGDMKAIVAVAVAVFIVTGGLIAAGPAAAQSYPNPLVKVVVPFAAGTGDEAEGGSHVAEA